MSEYPKLIALTGMKGSGKDLVGALLHMVGYRREGFADPLLKEVEASFDTPPLMPEHIMLAWIQCMTDFENRGWSKPYSDSTRQVLQWFGTEYRRTQDPDYWINKMSRRLETSTQPTVITDMRFLNEQNFVERWDGVIWRIERPGLKSDGHQSENECNFIKADYTINNDGDLQHLADQVLTALEVFRDGSESPRN